MKHIRTMTVAGLLAAAGWVPVGAQTEKPAREGEVTLIGCVELQRDYLARKAGRAGGGVGVGNEFVLTMAKPVGRRGQPASTGAAADYDISGRLEKDFLRYVGRQVEVIGVIEKAGSPMPEINVSLWHPVGDFCPAK